ncbi:conserved hypothetical protein [Theileria equi strain WA]|uniref:Uncharacterized protein n=1 Tax=Theileria equi strain WA TaxID=1537102 RepID=L1LEU8_THEEQ|nr:conserved hypothetical protein [Theileria equi strain WA]EKX73794.1 conserved hypothetical protein [Theileria equi strain WA]|eukprot:XP_004833246.1 conserved hypothetical protein [Theileria equi strain WA]
MPSNSEVEGEKPTLSDSSFNSLITHALNDKNGRKSGSIKESETESELLNFLKQIWTCLTDSSLYKTSEVKFENGPVIPFMHSEAARELIATQILKFLESYRDEPLSDSKDTTPIIPLSSIAQSHLLTCFKILVSFIIFNKDCRINVKNVTNGLLNLMDVLLRLVPSAMDLSTLLDFLTDTTKTLPMETAKVFAAYLAKRSEYFKRHFLALEDLPNNRQLIQTSGAKLIGLVKTFESSLSDDLSPEVSVCIFNVRMMLTYCLPISHLGVCNRQSISQPQEMVEKVSAEEWNVFEKLLLRPKCDGLSDYELGIYESIVSNVSHSKGSNLQIFDINSFASKQDLGFTESFQIPSYEVYSSYCDILNFISNPEVVVDQDEEYFANLQKLYSCILSHVNSLSEYPSSDKRLALIMHHTGNPAVFLSNSNNPSFWLCVLLSSSLALQTLKISHKKTGNNETIHSSLSERSASSIESIEKSILHSILRIKELGSMDAVLSREKEWVLWKQGGCSSSILDPLTSDEFTTTDSSIPTFSDTEEEETQISRYVDTLKFLESASSEQYTPSIGSDYSLVIDDLKLNRQSHSWYLEEIATDEPADTQNEKLKQKLRDYKSKMLMDDDPANDICESERGKNNPLFRFRFAKLFSGNFIEKFMAMSNEDIASGSVDCLLRSLIEQEDVNITDEPATKRSRV